MSEAQYIHIDRWNDFQHYAKRRPVWIKNYTRLIRSDAYRGLTAAQRGLLHGLWMEYAETCTCDKDDRDLSCTCLGLDLHQLNSRLGLASKMADYKALNHAGFITFFASALIARRYHVASTETEKEKEPPNPLPESIELVFREWASATGHERCKLTPDRARKIRARLAEGYSVEDLKRVPHGSLRDPWEDRAKHNDIGILYRNSQQVDKFIALALGGNGNGAGPMMASNQKAWRPS